MNAPVDPFLLYGTKRSETPPLRLHAGKLSVDFTNSNLRTILYDGVEVLRGISYLVRDRDWGTYNPRLENVEIDQQPGSFTIAYTTHCLGSDKTDLTVQVQISGGSDGILTFDAQAHSTTGFETNRCGFCILHPIDGIAGMPATVEHVDGGIEKTQFPDLIEPWQPFKDMRAITHTVTSDVAAECRMEGDTFEMEDQRNWSDASYKTYVRPLALPWPYRIPPNEIVRQRIALTITDKRDRTTASTSSAGTIRPVSITPGIGHGIMPRIGVIITPEEAQATLAAKALLAAVAPQDLLFHFDPLAGHDAQTFETCASVANFYPATTTLEIALPCRQSPATETAVIAKQMQAASFRPDSIVISPSVDRQSTPPGSQWPECPPLEEIYAAARAAFPDIRLGGGMLSYFTELNRKRVPSEPLDFITHCTNPIVHAADDLSVMQTLETLPFITRSVRAIYGDKPYRIGPSTIPMRQNPYGSRTMDNPDGERMPMANSDPRHNGRFAEAFALAYAIRVLDAGLESLTLSALTGPFGLIADDGEPTAKGENRPLLGAVTALAALSGKRWHQCISSEPGKIQAFAVQTASGRSLWLVNITATDQFIDLAAFGPREPVTLPPYSVLSVDVAD